MSFTNDVKTELISVLPEDDSCGLAMLAGFILSSGSIIMSRNGVTFSILSERTDILDYVKSIINRLYSDKINELRLITSKIGKNEKYEFEIPLELGNEILLDLGILSYNEKNIRDINNVVDHHLIIEDDAKIAFLKASFLAVGQASITLGEENKRGNGYHFEMQFTSLVEAQTVTQLMGEFGIISKKIEKGSYYLVYLKEGDSISDFFALIGASKSVIKIQQEMVSREMRNQINRESNCISANIDKTIKASLKQIRAIEIIDSTIGIENLPKNLIYVATLRRDNPEASLIDLVEMSSEKLTKAGMNYKLKKIIEIADNIYGGE